VLAAATRRGSIHIREDHPLMQRIGDWTFDPSTGRLRRCDGVERHLDLKEVSVLEHLAERAPRPVSVEALLDRSWRGVVVGDNTVHQVVGRLRRSLGDSARRPSYIETLPKRGYRLIVPVVDADVPEGSGERIRHALTRVPAEAAGNGVPTSPGDDQRVQSVGVALTGAPIEGKTGCSISSSVTGSPFSSSATT
jgi:DNA-binding winged helix-turn-helix (wHTH) protein